MGIVSLQITKPGHQKIIIGKVAVDFEGRLVSGGHGKLYYKWYSSLHSPPESDPANAALHSTENSPSTFSEILGVGSHIITFTAKDRGGDTLGDLTQVKDAGMAGGPMDSDAPCIIHIFIAGFPPNPGETLSKANGLLEAEAPIIWGVKIKDENDPGNYIPNPDYHAVNRVRFRWKFQPSGASSDTPAIFLDPALDELIFDPETYQEEGIRVVRYEGPLPDDLAVGSSYTLTLRVEDILDSTAGHEVSRQVYIEA